MSGNKVKGIFKGFRYLSQIFENEKEQDIQIGYPTDVKHVAHIGWDGPSVNSPSWMNEFKTSPGLASSPLDVQNKGQDNVKWTSEDPKRRSRADLAKTSKRQATGVTESPTREKNKARQGRKSSNKVKEESDSLIPDIPKKARRHRSKESSSASKLRPKPQSPSDSGSPTQQNLFK